MITLVFGSRNFEQQPHAEAWISGVLIEYCKVGLLSEYRGNFVMVTGGAWGTDRMCMKASRHVGVPVAVVRPNYDKYNHYATHKRNDFMIDHADRALGFWNGKYETSGTATVIVKCLKNEIPLVINKWDVINKEFVEIAPEVFILNAPLDWLKKWTTLKWIRENYPSYIFPK